MFTSLRLERFKSFKDAELKLGPFTVLIGVNASGKSNIRDAFRFLHGIGRGYSLAEIIGEKYREGGERVWTGIRGEFRRLLTGSRGRSHCPRERRDEDDDEWSFVIGSKSGSTRFEAYRVVSSSEVAGRRPGLTSVSIWKAKNSSRQSPTGIYARTASEDNGDTGHCYPVPRDYPFYGRGIIGRRVLLIVEPGHEEGFFADRHDLNEFSHLFKSSRFFDWSLDALRQPSVPGQVVLSDNGRNLSSVLQAICREGHGQRNLLSWVRELTPMDAVDFEFPIDPTGKVLATLVEKERPEDHAGLGLRRHVAVSRLPRRVPGPSSLVILFLRGTRERHPSDSPQPAARPHPEPGKAQGHPGRGDHTLASASRPAQRGVLEACLARLPAARRA